MNNKLIGCGLVLLVAFVMTSCGGGTGDSSDSGKAAESSSTPTPTESESESESPQPTPSGTLATGPVPCKKFSAPAGFKQAGAVPPVLCAFESSDARVTVTVGPGPATFEQLRAFEESMAKSNGVTPPALEEVTVDGWGFAVTWPEVGGFNRIDRYLADSAGNVLTCKVGVQGGRVDPTTQAGFCDGARDVLYTPAV